MSKRSWAVLIWTVCFTGCATATTTYRGVPATHLSDEQLVEELVSAAQGLGVTLNRTMYLMAARPEPAYVLTSSTSTFAGTMNATYNAYSMPVGYGVATRGSMQGTITGTTATRYQYTDVNATARLGNAVAVAISQAREAAYRRRGQEVLTEYQARVQTRRFETEQLISSFFAAKPELQNKRMLVAAVAPWAAAEGEADPRKTLMRTSDIIAGLSRGEGASGSWYGMFSQTTRTENGETFSFSEFVRLDLHERDGQVRGSGMLGSGEIIELSGTISGSEMSAAVANTTSAINVTLAAVTTPSQITGEFKGSGAGQRMSGTFVLLR
jgi:hypothetical protein